jgi:type IV fimbrial biogenesis protein FimT
MKANRQISGFSLNELLIVVVITAILIVLTVPSLIQYIQTRRLIGTSMQLYYSLQYAKSESIKKNATVYFAFQTGSNWCYGSNTNSNCNCSVANSCAISSTQAPNAGLISLSATGLNSNALQFDPKQGATNTSSNITFTNNQGDAITVKISFLGNISMCSSQVAGYQAC